MAELMVTPEELMNLGNKVAQEAEAMDQLIKELDGKVETVNSSWSGMASTSFYNSYVNMQKALKEFPKVVQAIAASAQGAAKAYDITDSELAKAMKG